jgi:hypothetical protein
MNKQSMLVTLLQECMPIEARIIDVKYYRKLQPKRYIDYKTGWFVDFRIGTINHSLYLGRNFNIAYEAVKRIYSISPTYDELQLKNGSWVRFYMWDRVRALE